MTDFWVVNGHLETCAYIQSLDESNFDGEDECTCEGWDDDDGFWDEDEDDDY